jgi:hypothetical protein
VPTANPAAMIANATTPTAAMIVSGLNVVSFLEY